MYSQHAIMYMQACMACTHIHLSAQFTLSQCAHKESVVYSKSANYWDYVYHYYDCVCAYMIVLYSINAKLKFSFHISKTLHNVITEDTLEPCHLHLVLSTSLIALTLAAVKLATLILLNKKQYYLQIWNGNFNLACTSVCVHTCLYYTSCDKVYLCVCMKLTCVCMCVSFMLVVMADDVWLL